MAPTISSPRPEKLRPGSALTATTTGCASGPTKVTIWSVGLAVEAQDGTEAVKRAEGFTPLPGAPRERVGHYWIDLLWMAAARRPRTCAELTDQGPAHCIPTNPLPPHGPRDHSHARPGRIGADRARLPASQPMRPERHPLHTTWNASARRPAGRPPAAVFGLIRLASR
jgi:hypothetical protein